MTGVQTCALPISSVQPWQEREGRERGAVPRRGWRVEVVGGSCLAQGGSTARGGEVTAARRGGKGRERGLAGARLGRRHGRARLRGGRRRGSGGDGRGAGDRGRRRRGVAAASRATGRRTNPYLRNLEGRGGSAGEAPHVSGGAIILWRTPGGMRHRIINILWRICRGMRHRNFCFLIFLVKFY